MVKKVCATTVIFIIIFLSILGCSPCIGHADNRRLLSEISSVILCLNSDNIFINEAGYLLYIVIVAGILSFGLTEYRKNRFLKYKLELSSIVKAEDQVYLDQLTKEKEWLVEELHHRVKNNLQIVVSLLDSQSSYLTNPESLQALKSSRHRMFAISLVHQKLYQTDSLSVINMEAYINDLLQYLQDEYECNQQVRIVLKTIPLHLNLTSAIPLGLILNEAVSNVLQYAFPGKAKGQIRISLTSSEHDHYSLQISDNGIGLPVEFDVQTVNSLGSILMIGLSQQIHAKLKIENENGVVITLNFKCLSSQTYPLSA